MAIDLDVVLVTGERRKIRLQGHSGSVANALARLDDWIETEDGGWIQKSFIVEVRTAGQDSRVPSGSDEEFERLGEAAGALADQADE